MPFQIVVGDFVAREAFHNEPAKFAAIELLPHTRTHAPEVLGGIIIDGKVRFGLPIPSGASLLAGFDPGTRIRGLDTVPAADRAPAGIVHLSFDVMVGTAFLLLGLVLWFAVGWWRRRDIPRGRWFLRAAAAAGVVAVVCLEAGWVVTEVGRQPWIVHGLLRTRDAVTTSGNVWAFLAGTLAIFTVVGVAAVLVLRGMTQRWRRDREADISVPYGPESSTP